MSVILLKQSEEKCGKLISDYLKKLRLRISIHKVLLSTEQLNFLNYPQIRLSRMNNVCPYK